LFKNNRKEHNVVIFLLINLKTFVFKSYGIKFDISSKNKVDTK